MLDFVCVMNLHIIIIIIIITTCEAGLVLSVTRILRSIPCVCMYVCVKTPTKPLNRFAYKIYQQIEPLTLIAIDYILVSNVGKLSPNC